MGRSIVCLGIGSPRASIERQRVLFCLTVLDDLVRDQLTVCCKAYDEARWRQGL